jgi:magnesium-transporting ATPase (P-type)
MITGDNIYIAVETARRAGIIGAEEKIIFLEGNRNISKLLEVEKEKGEFSRVFKGTLIEKV